MQRVFQVTRRALHSTAGGRLAASESATAAGTSANPAAAAAAPSGSVTMSSRSKALSPRQIAMKKRNKMIVGGIVAFAGVGFLFPFAYMHYNLESGNHYTSSKALSPNQVQRGAFLNSGTHDVGPDLSWHARHGITQREGAAVERQRAEERKKQAQKAQA